MRVEFISEDRAEVSAYRYDYGQTLEIAGLKLSDGFEVHFQNGTGNPEIRQGTVDENNVCTVAVPDITLSLGYDYALAWVYVKTPDSGTTVKTIAINILPREKPSDAPPVDDYPQIKKYADYVKENAEKVSEAEAVADKLKADAAAGLFNGKDGAPGPQGEKGDPGEQGVPGKDGKGIETIVVTTDEELTAALEKITAEFTVGSVYSIIGTGKMLGIESPFSDADFSALPAERIIIDRGTGEYQNALIVTNYINTTILHLNHERSIAALENNVASIQSQLFPKKYTASENTAYDAKTGMRFDNSVSNTHIIAKLILPESENAVTLTIGTQLFTFDTVQENSVLTFEAERIAEQMWKAEYKLHDSNGNLLSSDTVYKTAGISKVSRIAFNGYDTGKTFTVTYLAGG